MTTSIDNLLNIIGTETPNQTDKPTEQKPKQSFSEIAKNLEKYKGVDNATRFKVLRAVDEFFGVKESFNRYNKFAELGLMLAGGTINSIYSGRKINDLDFYLRDESKLKAATEYMEAVFGKAVYASDNALTYKRVSGKNKYEVQLITRFYGTPEEILNTFDFTIVQGCYDFQTESFVLAENFLPDIAKRVLRYSNNSRFPLCALIRTKKYQDRGYSLPNSTIISIAFALNRVDMSTYKGIKEQLLGVDTMFLVNFLESLDAEVELDDAKKMEFVERCCTLIDNKIAESFWESGSEEG
jgi:hypothetical protein